MVRLMDGRKMESRSCPFCGSSNRELRESRGYVVVACRNCGAIGPMKESPIAAMDAWNVRIERYKR